MSVEAQLQPAEEILYRAGTSRIALFPRSAGAGLAAVAALIAWSRGQRELAAGFAVAAALLALWALWLLLVLRSNEYVLTTHRLILQTGLLAKRSMDSRLDKINNVEHRQSLWGRILGYGDLEIDTASETGAAVFPRISRPLDFKRAILAAVEDYRGRMFRPPAIVPAAGVAPAAPPAASPAERIRTLKKLFDEGLITPQELEAKRREVLDEI
jgi:Bacterial PH domain/Short C-terminal domain